MSYDTLVSLRDRLMRDGLDRARAAELSGIVDDWFMGRPPTNPFQRLIHAYCAKHKEG